MRDAEMLVLGFAVEGVVKLEEFELVKRVTRAIRLMHELPLQSLYSLQDTQGHSRWRLRGKRTHGRGCRTPSKRATSPRFGDRDYRIVDRRSVSTLGADATKGRLMMAQSHRDQGLDH
jgi:hypothetical protein